MNKKILIFLSISILLITTSTQVISSNLNFQNDFKKLSTNIIFVDQNNTNGPWDGSYHNPFRKISDGIAIAKNDDIIYILKGEYKEQITIDKKLLIIGEDKKDTIINSNYSDFGIKIITDHVRIEKLTIKNSGGYKENSAIKINGNANKISECIIKRAKVGIFLNNSYENTIENITMYLCGKGISIKNSQQNKITKSEICHSGIGLNIINSENNDIIETYIHECGVAFYLYNSSNINFEKSAISDNNDNGGGGQIQDSNNVFVDNCNFLHNGFGLRIINSKEVEIKNSDFKNITHFAVWLEEGSENIFIENSELINNFRHCIYLKNSHCIVKRSNLYENLIDSTYFENSLIIAKNNYWGGIFGPLFNKGFRFSDIITFKNRKIKYFPWSIKPYQNIGSDWNVDKVFTKKIVNGYEDDPIKILGNDTDSDGIPNWWEEEFGYDPLSWNDHKRLDPDFDALNNFEEYIAYEWGADPFFKDIFLEFDWMESKTKGVSNAPSQELVNEMKERFLEHDISLHVDLGLLGGSEIIPYNPDITIDELSDLYWDYFLHNDLNNPRKNIFHYGLICDRGPGTGFAVLAWGHLNAFCICADVINEALPQFSRDVIITHASMHELGHTMGLVVDDFIGNDNQAATNPKYTEFWTLRNYKSLMNYRYTYSILDFSDGNNGRVDYNDWENMEFDFFKNTHFEWPKD